MKKITVSENTLIDDETALNELSQKIKQNTGATEMIMQYIGSNDFPDLKA